ncbi:MAG TPA: GNAT family N-acetyltransferase [Gammaproteobacteria bacterium]|nr:GNAT family N-acetyltransferase [Gammaproteobacteria bacterium]
MSARFEYQVESIRTEALVLDYSLVPWDAQIIGVPVAQIADLRVREPVQAERDYERFLDWCARQRIALCAARLPAERLLDSMFLEERGFRFVELNYLPRLAGLQQLTTSDENISVAPADASDRPLLVDMAARVFRHGRFHDDPRIGARLGDLRYATWMDNAFSTPQQRVLKCSLDGQIVGFCVVEDREQGHCFWSLNGLAPGHGGLGLGKRVWRSLLHRHRAEGAHTVSTSISSHNVAAFNLYVSLGFRFPPPSVTMQWCPAGRLG